jgi:transposase
VHDRRAIINGLRSVLRGGISWRALPHDDPPWQTVDHSFRVWRIDGTGGRLTDQVREQVRRRTGRAVAPTAAKLDSQSVRTTEQGGYSATMEPSGSVGGNAMCWWIQGDWSCRQWSMPPIWLIGREHGKYELRFPIASPRCSLAGLMLATGVVW